MGGAPVKERSTVVQDPVMNPNDRTRTNAPGMDNCIGPKATADHEVAA